MAAKNARITIKKIAEYLGVSSGTVSYVLSGQAKKRKISDATTVRVKEAANRLGYVPNQLARSLKTGSTGAVSLIFLDLMGGLAHRIVQGMTEKMHPLGYTPIISLYDRSEILTEGVGGIGEQQLNMILQRRDECVLCQPNYAARAEYIRLVRSGVPVVLFGSAFDDMSGLENISTVTWECGEAAELAVKHLISRGYKKIAFFGVRHGVDSDLDRFNAYEKTLKESGIAYDPSLVIWGPPYRFIKEEVIELLRPWFAEGENRPDSIFVINDAVAIGILEVLNSLGIKVPDEVAVIGMGNLDFARHDFVNLSTVREPLEEIGKAAVEVFLELKKKPDAAPIHRKVVCNELVVRNTA